MEDDMFFDPPDTGVTWISNFSTHGWRSRIYRTGKIFSAGPGGGPGGLVFTAANFY